MANLAAGYLIRNEDGCDEQVRIETNLHSCIRGDPVKLLLVESRDHGVRHNDWLADVE